MRTAAEQIVERLRLPVNATKARCPGKPGELLKLLENGNWSNCRPYSVADRRLSRVSLRGVGSNVSAWISARIRLLTTADEVKSVSRVLL